MCLRLSSALRKVIHNHQKVLVTTSSCRCVRYCMCNIKEIPKGFKLMLQNAPEKIMLCWLKRFRSESNSKVPTPKRHMRNVSEQSKEILQINWKICSGNKNEKAQKDRHTGWHNNPLLCGAGIIKGAKIGVTNLVVGTARYTIPNCNLRFPANFEIQCHS